MHYRPPFKEFWKQISILIILAFATGILIFTTQLLIQFKDNDELKKSFANGILTEKKDLRRGSFMIVLLQKNKKKKYDLAGKSQFYDQLKIGDSIAKLPNSFYFDVYRKSEKNTFEYINTIGYK